MGIPHLFHIFDRFYSEFSIIIKPLVLLARMLPPGADMRLIDRDRTLVHIPGGPALHPSTVTPFQVGNIMHLGGCARSHLRIVGKWIRLVEQVTRLCFNAVLIDHIRFNPLNKAGINSKRIFPHHRILVPIPVIKITNHRDRLCIRSPYRKVSALLLSVRDKM